MHNIVECAAKRDRKSMIALYKANKNFLYAFCCILLEDKEKAQDTAADVINKCWDKITINGIIDEKGFRHLLITEAAKYGHTLLFDKNTKKVSKTDSLTPYHYTDQEYTGTIADGLESLQTALKQVEPQARYVYLLHMAGGLNFRDIGQVIKQREAVAKYYFEMTVGSLSRTLDTVSGGFLSVEQVQSLLEQAMKAEKSPESVDASCYQHIKNRAKLSFSSPKILIPVICVICCAIGLPLFFALSPNDTTTTSFDTDQSSSATDSSTATADELDTSLTYYADIEIEDYGTITVELDEESAPITCANFVSLAESGFYNGLTFHRIIAGFMMQGGDPNGDGTGGSDETIVGEFADNGYDNDLSHTRGAISMARSSNYDSASSQFFIVHEDSTSLDGQYAVFGYVTEGLDIADAICESAEPTDSNGTIQATDQPIITTIAIRTESL